MTDEKLEKEAGNWLRQYLLCCNCEKKCNCIDSNSYCEEEVLKSYLAGAEPREKLIAELKKEKCELLGIIQGKDKAIAELEWQLKEITEDNDYWQKESAGLKETVTKMNNVIIGTFSNLTKAKELLKKIEKIVYSGENEIKRLSRIVDILAEAEQFLKKE